ncbi:hypothetical protein T4B_13999 [Trichinella pseudospiralis]|uniref:Uncharacterized protein n=2 Tax=Trichinella pseudospiralis TaxID=6337 RepID=A0A0V1J425_TRIPS|nr:hypothetical protein T4E_2484 [Trichinella pseudospiralis]KRY67174.1 hypothetical protein T4A_636 [Trichinella pseudospiralis]KRY82612.1 hypothetical protein T4D_15901 [Trichinella pseudospiralis]KRZ19972.1 hypothetical protein T4B_13999 [Trichinella pseudospiralis]KRZ29680.1 hypothetical protein T4C_2514 [Trichinella pseudospiralis]
MFELVNNISNTSNIVHGNRSSLDEVLQFLVMVTIVLNLVESKCNPRRQQCQPQRQRLSQRQRAFAQRSERLTFRYLVLFISAKWMSANLLSWRRDDNASSSLRDVTPMFVGKYNNFLAGN